MEFFVYQVKTFVLQYLLTDFSIPIEFSYSILGARK